MAGGVGPGSCLSRVAAAACHFESRRKLAPDSVAEMGRLSQRSRWQWILVYSFEPASYSLRGQYTLEQTAPGTNFPYQATFWTGFQ